MSLEKTFSGCANTCQSSGWWQSIKGHLKGHARARTHTHPHPKILPASPLGQVQRTTCLHTRMSLAVTHGSRSETKGWHHQHLTLKEWQQSKPCCKHALAHPISHPHLDFVWTATPYCAIRCATSSELFLLLNRLSASRCCC